MAGFFHALGGTNVVLHGFGLSKKRARCTEGYGLRATGF
jgi:hypothetical protein